MTRLILRKNEWGRAPRPVVLEDFLTPAWSQRTDHCYSDGELDRTRFKSRATEK